MASIEQFLSYAQTRKIVPKVVNLSWVYLVHFPDSKIPERQSIDVNIFCSGRFEESVGLQHDDHTMRMSAEKVQIRPAPGGERGIISYSIDHTRTSWGLDIENVIRDHIDRVMEIPSVLDRMVSKISLPLNWFTTILLGLICVNFVIDQFFKLIYLSEPNSDELAMTEIIVGHLINGHIAKYIVASVIVGVFILVVISSVTDMIFKSINQVRPSFIVLSDGDQRERQKALRSYDRRWIKLAGVVVVDLAFAISVAVVEHRVGALWSSMVT